MKIGDKVRFLSEVGGGIVAGFPDKETVLICDEDGFEIPMLIRECVVIETDDYNIAKVNTRSEKSADNRFRSQKPDTYVHSFDDDEDEKPITFKPKAVERRGADTLNIFIGYVPVDIKELSNTAFESYLINDSNYCLHFALLTHEGASCRLRHEGIVEPNTKLFLEEFQRDALPEMERISVMLFAYKEGKTFSPKPPLSITLRPDCTKFYKLHTFQHSDFFDTPAYVIDLVRDDRPTRSVYVDAEQIKEALTSHKKDEKPRSQPARTPSRNVKDPKAIIEIDLHATEILETTSGMQAKDILEYQLKVFRDTMEAHRNETGRRIVFIHGKGDGVLRNALIKSLKTHFKQCLYQDASFREYGYGATMVTIRKEK